LRKKKLIDKKSGILFYSREQFQKKWDISPPTQREIIKRLEACSLLKELEVSLAPHNWATLKLSNVGCFVFVVMLEHLNKECHKPLFKMILRDKKLQKIIRTRIKHMESEYSDIKLKNDCEGWRIPEGLEESCNKFCKRVVTYYNEHNS